MFIFQPAEEGPGGARATLREGLFERFPCDEIYGFHNQPGGGRGRIKRRTEPMMAAAHFFDVRIPGEGSHADRPHRSIDPAMIAAGPAQALRSIVVRDIDPRTAIVLSITRMEAGPSCNVILVTAQLAGTGVEPPTGRPFTRAVPSMPQATRAPTRSCWRRQLLRASSSNSSESFCIMVPPSSSASVMVTARR